MNRTYILLIGAAGSGKSTLGRELSNVISLPYISTGDILRARNDSSTVTGVLASDDLMYELVTDRLNARDCRRGAILDGYPRTLRQDEDFRRWIRGFSAGVMYLHLEVDDQTAVDRLLRRSSIEGRADDHVATIKTRLADFRRLTMPIVDNPKLEWPLYTVDGSGHSDDTFGEAAGLLGEYLMRMWIAENDAVGTEGKTN